LLSAAEMEPPKRLTTYPQLRRVFANGGCLRINIPADITKALDITKGDTLIVTANDHQIVMEKAGKV
jgi:antitoxin component of MazEF toxin-antitoxin module